MPMTTCPISIAKGLHRQGQRRPGICDGLSSQNLRHGAEEVSQSNLFFSPQLYVARFYHVNGNDVQARQIVRTMVQVALQILSDDDEDNDVEGFVKLIYVFLPLNDNKNALAALALCTLCSRSDSNDAPEYSVGVSCDGHCKYTWETASEMWLCKDCITMTLERNCREKLQEGEMEYNVCGRDHDFLEVPKWNGDRMDSLPKGMVPWGNQNITLSE